MSNKNNKRIIRFKGSTILQQFKNYVSDDDSSDNIIRFLAMKNAQMLAILGKDGDVSEELKEEIVEFFEYFMTYYDKQTYKARMRNWGEDDALILRMGGVFLAEREEAEQEEFLNSLSPNELYEAETLCNTIMSIRKNKTITIILGDDGFEISIPRTIPRDSLDFVKTDFTCICAQVIEECGVMVVRAENKDKTFDIFAVKGTLSKKWEPVSKENMKWAHCTCHECGEEIEPEKDVNYTEIQRPELKRIK